LPKHVGLTPFVEYSFVGEEQVVVVLRGREQTRVALALCFSRDANLALLLGSSRQVLRSIEHTVDLTAWEV
jgi:hypothetical protein